MITAKKILRPLWLTAAALLALAFTACIILQVPSVQTALAGKVVSVLEKRLGGRVQFSRIHFTPFNAFSIEDVLILDDTPFQAPEELGIPPQDTIFRARSIFVTMTLRGLLSRNELRLGSVKVEDGLFVLANEYGTTNLKRVFAGIADDGKATAEKPDGSAGETAAPGSTSGNEPDYDIGTDISVGKADFRNFEFRLVNYGKAMSGFDKGKFPRTHGINWCDLDVIANVKARDLKCSGGYITGTAESMNAVEKSGYRAESITGEAKVGHGAVEVENLHIRDAWSDIRMSRFAMLGKLSSYGHFEQEVAFQGKILESRVQMKSISYFAPTLKDNPLIFNIYNADVDGPVADLDVTGLRFREETTGMRGLVSNRLSGLPKAADMVFDSKISSMEFDASGAAAFINAWTGKNTVDPHKLPINENITFTGAGSGSINDLTIEGSLTSDSGGAVAEAYLKNILLKDVPIEFGGALKTENLDLGAMLGKEMLGKVSARAGLRAVLNPGSPSVKIDSLFVDRLSLLGYDYSRIAAAGTWASDTFDGKIICNDPNLNFLFQGTFTPSAKTPNALYKFYANLGYADLRALNLDRRGQASRVSGQVNANFMRIRKADMIGDVNITGLTLEDDSGRHDIGNVLLRSHFNEDLNRINLSSSFADGSYVGSKPVSSMIQDIQALTSARELPSLYRTAPAKGGNGRYSLKIDMHDSRDLLSFIKRGFYIADSTRLNLSVTPEGEVKANLTSPRIALGNKYLRRLSFTLDNREDHLRGKLSSEELKIGGMKFMDSEFSLFADDDLVGAGFTYDNKTDLRNQGEVYLTGGLSRVRDTLTLTARLHPSNIYYEGNGWKLTGKEIRLSGKDLSIEDILAECGDQRVSLGGGWSSSRNETLSLALERFDIGLLNYLTGLGLGLEGVVSGDARLSSPLKTNPGLLMYMTCDSTKVAGHDAGVITLASAWDASSGRFHAKASDNVAGTRTFGADAFLDPATGEIDAALTLDGFNAGYVRPVLKSVFSSLGGSVSGRITAKGKAGEMKFGSSDAHFDSTTATLDFTNVPYTIDGPFHLDNAGVHFDAVTVRDRRDGRGELSGSILFGKEMEVDAHVRMTGMECLNTDSGPSFYGNVAATGRVDITGPVSSLTLDIDAETAGDGSLHVPISSGGSATRSDLLTFKEEEKYIYIDPYDLMMNRIGSSQRKDSDMSFKLRVRANPGVLAVVDIGSDQGSGLTGRGRGDINLTVRPARKEFSINGDYTLSEGSFRYNALGIASRTFSITNGSSIRFTGDVMQSILDMNATYSTRANVSTLIADTTSVSSRKIVNCGISVTDRLSNPTLKFSIEVPDLDPTTQARVESALNTEDKLQKQFLSLLISGGFLPDEQSGIVNNNSMLFSNVAEIMASQLNNILEKLEIPIDFGLNYQEADSGNDIFDVAVSTQLFNNRVLVNGTLGNRKYTPTSGSDEMVGDFDVEIKLDRAGTLRLNLFTHSADDYTNYLDNLQRNGVGIAYQREFSNFRTFLKNLFKSRRRREAEAIRAAEQPRKEKRVIEIRENE